MPTASASASTSNPLIAVGTTGVTATIDTASDQDWYRFDLSQGVTYTILMQGVGTGANTLFDPLIDGIFNGSSAFQAGGFNNDGLIGGPNGRDASLLFTAGYTGDHWIAAAGDMGSTGTYTLKVLSNASAADSVPGDISSSVALTVGGSVTGNIDGKTDADWYKVMLTAGNTYTFRMRGQGTGTNTLADPLIAGIYTAAGVFIPNTYADDLNGRDASVTLKAAYTGEHYIAAEGAGDYVGSFTLDATQTGTETLASTATTATLTVGGSATVTIDAPYDHDWYAVSLTGGTTYQFSLAGTTPNRVPGIYGIYNASGAYIEGYSMPTLGSGT